MPRQNSYPKVDSHRATLAPEVAFGQILRERRMALGFTQADLADDDQLDRSYVSKLELGKRQVCLRGFIHLAKMLETTPDELMAAVMRRIHGQE